MAWVSAMVNRFFSHFVATVATPPNSATSTASSPSVVLHPRHDPSTSAMPSSATTTNQSPIPYHILHLNHPDVMDIDISRTRPPPLHLLSLPDDILLQIVRHATHCHHDNPSHTPQHVVEQRSYASACALTAVSQKTAALFYASLDNVSLASSPITDCVVESLARRAGPALKRLVLRGSNDVTNASLIALARHATALRSIDLSFLRAVDASGLQPLCAAAGTRLRHLLLRKCHGVDDDALRAIVPCTSLHTLDVSYCPRVTDEGMRVLLAAVGCSLRFFALAHDAALTDGTFAAIGFYCRNVVQLCARGLPFVTDIGFLKLCAGIGGTVEGIDVTLCHSLTRDATLRALSSYCYRVYVHIMSKFASRTLRQIIISTLRQNIFIVHGSDPSTGKDTVHTVLIDNGDIVSASLLSSGTTDLSLLGIVLCKSYGSCLSEETKQMLEDDYGIPTSALTD